MKKMKRIICVIEVIFLCFALFSCGKSESKDLWENALYKENTELGDGEKTIVLEVLAEDKSVELTVHTDEKMLGDALLGAGLIKGEKGAYGIYVKEVNGIVADYDADKSYWGLNKNGEGMMTGADLEEIFGGEHYEFAYTKQ